VAPVDRAVGRSMVAMPRVGASLPIAPPYFATTAGPASSVTEAPARLPAMELKVTAALTRGCTISCSRAPTPAGTRAGSFTGKPACAAACNGEAAGWAAPEDHVRVPNRSALDPFGVEKPPNVCPSPSLVSAATACRSLRLNEIGATWVGAKTVVSVAAAAVPATTIATAPIASAVRSDMLGKRTTRGRARSGCRRLLAPRACGDSSSGCRRAQPLSTSGTSRGAENSWAAYAVSSAISSRRALQWRQPATWSVTRSGTARGSSSSRRSIPSGTCLTVHLLSKRGLRPSEQSPNVSNLHPERIGDLYVAHAAVAHHKNRGRAARQPTQDATYVRPALALDYRFLGARQEAHGPRRQLTIVPTPLTSNRVQR